MVEMFLRFYLTHNILMFQDVQSIQSIETEDKLLDYFQKKEESFDYISN